MPGSTNRFMVIIPAREKSTRLPEKVLADICGKPMIQHVYQQACLSYASRVILAVDGDKLARSVKTFANDIELTQATHPSGTSRLSEVTNRLITSGQIDADDIIVNLQADEPFMPPAVINQVAGLLLQRHSVDLASIYSHISCRDELEATSVVKLVLEQHNYAICFSRASIPFVRSAPDDNPDQLIQSHIKAGLFKRHLGIYAYRARFLQHLPQLQHCAAAQSEQLEQLGFLYAGKRIIMAKAVKTVPHGVDTIEDLRQARSYLQSQTRAVSPSGLK